MRGEADPRGQAAGAAARPSRPSQEGTGTTTRRARWDQLRRYLWQPRRPHGEQPAERVVGPLELFYDLAVLVLVAQSAHHFAGHLTWRGLGEFTASYGSHSRHGRGDGQPHRSRPRRPHARCHGLDAERRRGRRAVRDDARIRKPASLAARPALLPARRPSLRRCCCSVPRRRSGPARATRSWPRSHRAAQHPVGNRRRAPPG
jgi:hypothetical protein